MTRHSAPRRPGSHQPQPWQTHYVDPDNPDPDGPEVVEEDLDDTDRWLAEHELYPVDEGTYIWIADQVGQDLDDRPLWQHDAPTPCVNQTRGCPRDARSGPGSRCGRCTTWHSRHHHEWPEKAV